MFKRKSSKKGDKKKGSLGRTNQREGEERLSGELPQVWLPTPQEPHPDGNELLPGGEEQQRFESFLVREEGRTGGWDEREELNYADIAANLSIQIENGGEGAEISLPTQQPSNIRPSIRRHEQVDEVFDFDEAILEERDGEIQHSRQPSYKSPALSAVQSETHSLFNYAQSTVYHVHFLGMLSNISNLWEGEVGGREGSSDPNNLLKLIEHSQRQGIMPWVHQKGSQRILVISKYGIKVTDTKRQRVYVRHTLHKIITVVHFIDMRGHSLLAVKLNHTNDEEDGRDEEESIGSFDLFVYECESENQATEVCVMLGQVFDSVLNKMKLEDNLGIPH
ncbi:PREDICTED: uncharacterized protein LOC109590351 [Amphimedon queenslandica]|uniref:PID domain-containing protein n=1 Tax=Amphimedon queenslandica TaxID=400682 RepID=A0A1X7VLX7_AMPQE|nr:PREDICTED: uncharacterized protein LOC109590351 [Amphimedon queenslandica]|eukprot:XP_019861836.1 PREDICTED: uncharacterized protein LOC109590351 [Amphimedon queenslandica]